MREDSREIICDTMSDSGCSASERDSSASENDSNFLHDGLGLGYSRQAEEEGCADVAAEAEAAAGDAAGGRAWSRR